MLPPRPPLATAMQQAAVAAGASVVNLAAEMNAQRGDMEGEASGHIVPFKTVQTHQFFFFFGFVCPAKCLNA